jgi:hypothetical protein
LIQIIVEDEDGEVVKSYELPPKPKPQQADQSARPVLHGLKRMGAGLGSLAGLSGKPQAPAAESSEAGADSSAGPSNVRTVRQGPNRMSTWGFGGRGTETATDVAADEEDDDRRIRFTIGGAGRRLTKEDFLKEVQSLDPKARSDVIAQSDAPLAMKIMAKKDANPDVPGNNRLFSAKGAKVAPERGTASAIGAEMARHRGARVDDETEDEDEEDETRKPRARDVAKATTRTRGRSNADMTSDVLDESAVEKKRREKALRGIDETELPRGRLAIRDEEQRRRGSIGSSGSAAKMDEAEFFETAAEKRRREAALGVGGDGADDSDDDDTPRVPPPVAQSRGIRFAQSPVRGKR